MKENVVSSMKRANTDVPGRFNRKARICALLAVLFLCCCFIFTAVAPFLLWIFIGTTVYCTFLAIYYLVMASNARNRFRKPPKQSDELREYISFHLTLLISILLGGLLIAVIIIFFVA